ncbi:MAG: glycosyl hydrolase 115 family protein [Saprospiraceae bacterium]|nr:glycosyl hydrolase 115 family protein [Saprospiraceae bacterium]
MSYQWGVKDLWIVNVGDLKPMELPISLFLDFAYDTKAIRANDLPKYYVNWATQQFGDQHAKEIADILALTTKYSARRTPEMLKPNTYSLTNYREADRILEEYKELLERSTKVYKVLPKSHQSAYYQLVHFPIEIAYNLNEMYIAAGKMKPLVCKVELQPIITQKW